MPVPVQELRLESDWTAKGLKRACVELKQRIVIFGCSSEIELAAYWPGGSNNKIKDGRGKWIYCYGEYKRFLGRRTASEVTRSDDELQNADAQVSAAIAGLPVRIDLPDGRELFVHPKSYVSTGILEALDDQLAGLEIWAKNLRESPTPTNIMLFDDIARVEMYQTAVILWIITTPGPGLPFDLWDTDPQVPTHIMELQFMEQQSVLRGWRQLSSRLRAIRALVDDEKEKTGQGRTSWSSFLGSFPVEQQHEFAHYKSLMALLASVRMHNSAHASKKPDANKE